MSTSPALRAAARVVSSGMLRNTSRLTAGGLRQKPDRKSTRLNSSHSQISYAVFLYRKSTRLNSSHSQISYAVFCLKKKKILGAGSSCEDHHDHVAKHRNGEGKVDRCNQVRFFDDYG